MIGVFSWIVNIPVLVQHSFCVYIEVPLHFRFWRVSVAARTGEPDEQPDVLQPTVFQAVPTIIHESHEGTSVQRKREGAYNRKDLIILEHF